MRLGTVPDRRLVAAAAAGDRAAFDELVRRHRDRVWAVALRICGDPEDAEDVLQETFLSAWRALPRFRRGAQLSTWLYRIAVNKSYDAVGRRRPEAALEAVPEPAEPRDPFVASSRRDALSAGLAALPLEFRTAVVLCDVLGLTPGEAAEVLDVPSGTVKSRCFRGRAQLARLLAEPEGRGDV